MKKNKWLLLAIVAGVALYWWKNGDCGICGKSPHAVGKENAGAGLGVDVYL
jgi:hypothetical protein